MAVFKKLLTVLLAASFMALACAALAVSPSDYDMSAPENLLPEHLYAESALLIDEPTGEVLLSKNSRVRMYPASTTKIMTLLLGLESGIGMDEIVTIPDEAADAPADSSLIPVKPGDRMTFGDLLYGFMLSSGNDGANAVAVLVDGSLDAFVERMNRRAGEIGCEGTRFANPSGYHEDGHYSTARDLAMIAREAMKNPEFRAIVASASCDITITRGSETRTGTIVSRNSLLQSGEKYYYPDCTGIKTGHHRRAGWCFVGSAERGGRRLISVVMNCEGEMDKWYDTARLFEYGFTRYEDRPVDALLDSARGRFARVTIENAAQDDPEGGSLLLRLEQSDAGGATLPVLRDGEAGLEAVLDDLAANARIEWSRPLEAPVAAGETLGTVRCALPDGRVVSARLTSPRDVAAQPAVETPKPAPTLSTQAPEADIEAPQLPEERVSASGAPMLLWLLAAAALALATLIALRAIARRKRARRRRRRAAARTKRRQ